MTDEDGAIANIALARQAYAALESHRQGKLATSASASEYFQPFFDLLADDAVLKAESPKGLPEYPGGETFGKQAVIDHYKEVLDHHVEDFQLEKPMEFFGSGNRVVVLGAERFTIKKTGVKCPMEFAIVLDFRNGRITRVTAVQL